MRRAVIAALALTVVTAVLPASAAGDRVIAREARPTAVNAYAGRVVWSSFVASRDAYVLKVSYRGKVRRVPVRQRQAPFDVDLGPDARGRTVAVYSRCRKDRSRAGPTFGMFEDPSASSGCDIYEYSFASRRERRLELPGMRATAEYLPTIWGGTIAFARVFDRRHGRAGKEPFLYYARLPSGRARRTPQGTRGDYRRFLFDLWEGGPGPTGIDLRRGRLAFSWMASLDHCPHYADDFPMQRPELWVGRLGQRPRRIEHDCWGEATDLRGRTTFVSSPSLDGARLWYYQHLWADAAWSRLRAYNLADRTRFDKRLSDDTMAIARDNGTTYYTRLRTAGDIDATDVVRARTPTRPTARRRR